MFVSTRTGQLAYGLGESMKITKGSCTAVPVCDVGRTLSLPGETLVFK